MVGTFPPLYQQLPDLTLLFIANNPGTLPATLFSLIPACHGTPIMCLGLHSIT